MLKKWIENLAFSASNDDIDARRKYHRRSTDSAVAMIGEKTYAIENWSEGGLLFNGDEKMFGEQDNVDIVVKFKLPSKLVEVEQQGRVVRKSLNRIAVQFGPVTSNAARKFKQVIEEAVTREFVESQIA